MVDKIKIGFRTYRGVAGVIRRRIVFAVAFALIYGSLAITLGFLLRKYQIFDLPDTFLIIGLLFVMGLLINGWLVLRLMRRPLEAIEKVEDGLVQMASSGDFKLPQNDNLLDFQSSPFLQAYYGLLQHVDSVETQHLEFLAKVAHDIRSPVATIMGYSELLTDDDLRHNEQFIDQTYEIIRKQGSQVCRLVEEAVLAAKLDAGRHPLHPAEFSLDEFVSRLAGEAQIELDREVIFENLAGEVRIFADAINLREAIRNLIDNAVKFSKPPQPVRVCLAQSEMPGWIEIQVQDHGFGIEEKDKPTLFRRFNRIRDERTQGIPGTGLGLHIAQGIAQMHAGSILVESRPGEGSTFTIRLPVDRRSA